MRAANRDASRSPNPPGRDPAAPRPLPVTRPTHCRSLRPPTRTGQVRADAGAQAATRSAGGRAARDRCTTAHPGAPSVSTAGIPSNAPADAPSHRCAAEPAGTSVVSTATARTGSQKNRAGQRGPRRRASRADAAVNSATTAGSPARASTASPARTGPAAVNAAATLPRPR